MADIGEYTFQPALIGKKRSARLFDQHFELSEGGEDPEEIAYEDITSVRYINTSVNKYRFFQFHLTRSNGKPVYLNVNASQFSSPTNDPDVRTLYQLMGDLIGRLGAGTLEEVEIGYNKRGRMIWFGMGLVTVLFSIGIFILALNTGVRSDKLRGGAIPLGMLLLFGVVMCAGSNPWAPPVRLPVADFQIFLSASLAEETEEAPEGSTG
ncbi:MAG: hypothetical protein AAFX02_06895 [Pseudomonadota bacterium]